MGQTESRRIKMFYQNMHMLRGMGFKHIVGFSKYMIKNGRVYNILMNKKMVKRKDGRYQLTNNEGKRVIVSAKNIKEIK